MADGQKSIAEHFATKGENQFASVEHRLSERGVPLIKGAAAQLECEIQQRISIGTHTVFVGQVVGTDVEAVTPLVYHDARYGMISHI